MQHKSSGRTTSLKQVTGLMLALSLGACMPEFPTEPTPPENQTHKTSAERATLTILASTELDRRKTSSEPASLTGESPISVDGIGPIQIGMTTTEAETAAGIELIGYINHAIVNTCTYVRPQPGPAELDFMVIDDRIARIDIRTHALQEVNGELVSVEVGAHSRLKTAEGIGLGDSEDAVIAAYPDAEITEHEYIEGHYLTVTPPNQPNHSLVFETDGRQVTYIRSGRSPEVHWIERCS